MGGQDDEHVERYWSDFDASARDLLHALREFRWADDRMRRRIGARMQMNVTDIQALQLVVAGERSGAEATPMRISEELGISTASTTKLIDRLVAADHVERGPHPHDRRSVVLTATAHAHEEIHHHLGGMHAEMAAAARALDPAVRPQVIEFLSRITQAIQREGPGPAQVDRESDAP